MLAGGDRPEVADVVVSLGAVGTDQWSTLVLSGCPERSFEGRSRIWLQWVLKKQPEVGGGVCYHLDQVEAAGGLLDDW